MARTRKRHPAPANGPPPVPKPSAAAAPAQSRLVTLSLDMHTGSSTHILPTGMPYLYSVEELGRLRQLTLGTGDGSELREAQALELLRTLWSRGVASNSHQSPQRICRSRLTAALDGDVIRALEGIVDHAVLRNRGRDLAVAWKGIMSDRSWTLGKVETWCVFGDAGCRSSGFLTTVRKLADAEEDVDAVVARMERAQQRRRQRLGEGKKKGVRVGVEWCRNDALQALAEWDREYDQAVGTTHDGKHDAPAKKRSIRYDSDNSADSSDDDSDDSDHSDDSDDSNSVASIEIGRDAHLDVDVNDLSVDVDNDVGYNDYCGFLSSEVDTSTPEQNHQPQRHQHQPDQQPESPASASFDPRTSDRASATSPTASSFGYLRLRYLSPEQDDFPVFYQDATGDTRPATPDTLSSKMPLKRGWTSDELPWQVESHCKIPRLGRYPEDVQVVRKWVELAQTGFDTLIGQQQSRKEGRAVAWDAARKTGVMIEPAHATEGRAWVVTVLEATSGEWRVFGTEEEVDMERLRADLVALIPNELATEMQRANTTPARHHLAEAVSYGSASGKATGAETSFILAFATGVLALAGKDIPQQIDVHVWFHTILGLCAERNAPPAPYELPSFEMEPAADTEEGSGVVGRAAVASISSRTFLQGHEQYLQAGFTPLEAQLRRIQAFLKALDTLNSVHQWATARRGKMASGAEGEDDSMISNSYCDDEEPGGAEEDEVRRMGLQAQIDGLNKVISARQGGTSSLQKMRDTLRHQLAALDAKDGDAESEERLRKKAETKQWKELVYGRMDRVFGFVCTMKCKGRNKQMELKGRAERLLDRLEGQLGLWRTTLVVSESEQS